MRSGHSVTPMDVVIRAYEPKDAAGLAAVMWRSVRVAARADYSAEQTEAWLPAPPLPEAMHQRASDGRAVFVADGASGIVGYIDLEADGHIDHLYCMPEVIGIGVAVALYEALERHARSQGLERLYVEASESAHRFFKKRGFTVDARHDWELRGVPIHNYAMSFALCGPRRSSSPNALREQSS